MLSPVGYEQRWQTTTLTGHMVSELTGFLCLCLSEQHLPKKDAASWCLHFSTFPSDPSLKAWTAAVEIREERPRTHTEDLRHINSVGQDRSGSDWSGLQWQKTGSRMCRQPFSLPLKSWINWISTSFRVDRIFCWNFQSQASSFWGLHQIISKSRTGLSAFLCLSHFGHELFWVSSRAE